MKSGFCQCIYQPGNLHFSLCQNSYGVHPYFEFYFHGIKNEENKYFQISFNLVLMSITSSGFPIPPTPIKLNIEEPENTSTEPGFQDNGVNWKISHCDLIFTSA